MENQIKIVIGMIIFNMGISTLVSGTFHEYCVCTLAGTIGGLLVYKMNS